MKNKILIGAPQILKNSITYQYQIEGDWLEAFHKEKKFNIEYSCDISTVPESIAVVPLLCNVLPVSWVYDAEIQVNSCDKDFLDSIQGFKQGYIDMYPRMQFGGSLIAKKIEINRKSNGGGTAAFFSGGVDAFNTLVNHVKEKPTLLTLWGADITFEDTKGWENVHKQLRQTAEAFQIDYITIKSTFRHFLEEEKLSMKVKENGDKEGWWHGFQHGIGVISHAAPVAFMMDKSMVYFASTFTYKEKGLVTCASDPTIDNNLHFCNTQVVHDGYEFNRQDKIHNITEFSKKTGIKIPLRVCWQSKGGTNCCHCEKCWRTILEIIAEKEDPRKFGFDYTEREFKHIVKLMKRSDISLKLFYYDSIQTVMRRNYKLFEIQPELKWFYKINIEKLGFHPFYSFARKCRNRIVWILKINS